MFTHVVFMCDVWQRSRVNLEALKSDRGGVNI